MINAVRALGYDVTTATPIKRGLKDNQIETAHQC